MSSCDGTSRRRSCNDSLWWSNIARVIHIFRIEHHNEKSDVIFPWSSMLSTCGSGVKQWCLAFLCRRNRLPCRRRLVRWHCCRAFFQRAFLSRNFLPKKRCSFSSDETIQVVSKLAEYVCDKDRLPVDLWRGCEVNCGATAAAWDLRMIPGVPWPQAILLVGKRLSYKWTLEGV